MSSAHPRGATPVSNDDMDTDHELLGLRIKRCDEHDDTLIIYHIDPKSHAANHTSLKAGCEILAVNDHRVRGSACRTVDMMRGYLERDGKVDLLTSFGDRPRGSLYLVAKNNYAGGNGSDGDYDAAQCASNVVDGLELEETKEGNVRIISSHNTAKISSVSSPACISIWVITFAPSMARRLNPSTMSERR